MKSLLAASALSLISTSAFACPDLTGTFECKGRLVGLSQETTGNTTTFQQTVSRFFGGQILSSTFSDNGIAVNVPEALDLSTISAHYSCRADQALHLESKFNDSVAGQTTMTKDFTIDSNGDLAVATQLTFADGGSRSLGEVCRRK